MIRVNKYILLMVIVGGLLEVGAGCGGDEAKPLRIKSFNASIALVPFGFEMTAGQRLTGELELSEAVNQTTYVDVEISDSTVLRVTPEQITYESGDNKKEVTIEALQPSQEEVTVLFQLRDTENSLPITISKITKSVL